jgi:hypothetical protein
MRTLQARLPAGIPGPAGPQGTPGAPGAGISTLNYASLRLLYGAVTLSNGSYVNVSSQPINGLFQYDSSDVTSADNGGTIIVDAQLRRWKRIYSGPIYPDWFGATGDGVANDRPAFVLAVATGLAIALTAGKTYYLATPLNVGAGVNISCTPALGANLKGANGSTTLRLTGDAKLSNFRMIGSPTYHIEQDAGIGNLIGGVIEGVQFEGGSFCIYLYGYPANRNDGLEVIGCRSIGVANPLFFENLSNGLIDRFVSTGASGANILFKSGRDTRIVNYDLDGGTTGITMLGGVSITGNGAWALDIGAGAIRNPTEEFISFDCNGASATDCTMRERAQVASKTSDANFYYITLNAPAGSWAGSSGVFVGAYMCFVDGNVAGGCYEIYSNSNAGEFAFRRGTATGDQQMSAAAYAAITVGDLVVVGSPFLGVKVDGVTMQGATGADNYMNGVLFYGGVFGARATNIKANFRRTLAADYARGVTFSALSGINSSGSYVSGTTNGRLAPVMNCVVEEGVLDGCDLALEPTLFGGADSPEMRGTRTSNNTINGGQRICVDNEDLGDDDVVVS